MVRSDTVSSRLEWCFLRASYFASRGVMKRAVPRDFPGCSVPVLSAQKPWFSQGFSRFWPVPLAVCSAHAGSVHGVVRRCISRRAAQIESFFESRESSKHWVFECSGSALIGFRGGGWIRTICVVS